MKTLSKSELLQNASIEEKFFEDVKKRYNAIKDDESIKTPAYWNCAFMKCESLQEFESTKKAIKMQVRQIRKEIFMSAFDLSKSLSKKTVERLHNYLRVTSFCSLIFTTKESKKSIGKFESDGEKLYFEKNERNDFVGLLNAFRSARLYMVRFGFGSSVVSDDNKKRAKALKSLAGLGISETLLKSCKDLRALAINFGIDYDNL